MTTRRWTRVCSLSELDEGRGVAALVDDRQVALFLLPGPGSRASRLRAVDNFDPAGGANVLARGLIGSTGDLHYVASPLLKHRYDLATGACLDGEQAPIRVWPVRSWGGAVEVLSVRSAGPDPPRFAVTTRTHCPFCALQCGMGLKVTGAGEQAGIEVTADVSFPVNKGRMCVKGWASASMIGHPDRLLTPLMRSRGGRLVEASWEQALDWLAGRIQVLQHAHGPDSIGVFGSGALTNEKAYLLGKFARVALATSNIDYNGRYCMSSAAAGANRALGLDRGLPFPLADVAQTGALVLWGANPADTMPPLIQYVDAMRAGGGRLIVVDPRRTATAALADLHLQPVPGTDLAVALGLLGVIVADGLADDAYIGARTSGWEELRRIADGWPPARVAAVSGIGEQDLRAVVEALAGSASMLLTGRGPEQQSKGTDTVSALINVMLSLGKVGRPASGYGCLTGQANGQGGREHGQKADQLPGYRRITDPAARAWIASVWGVDAGSLPGSGYSAVEMLESIGRPDGVRGMLVAGSNIATASPDARRLADQVAGLELLAVLDSFPSRTTELADVVLPVAQWAEEDGTLTNLEGRVIRRRAATAPPRGVRSEIDVICDLADRLGHGNRFSFAGPEAVFDELREASRGGPADYAGITYHRLERTRGIHWPCPAEDHPGTPRCFADRFGHPDGLARFTSVTYRPAAEEPDDAYPLYFTTGRYREQYNSGTQTRRLRRLIDARPEPRLQVHPDLIARLDLDARRPLRVESRRGHAVFAAEVTGDIRPDTVFAPFHWEGAGCANALTSAALDPVSRMPEFKVCAVRLLQEPGEKPPVGTEGVEPSRREGRRV